MFVGVDEKLSIVADVLLRCVSYQLLQQAIARTNERVTTTFIMESIIRRTIVVVEERVGGQLVNRAIKEVRSPRLPSSLYFMFCLLLYNDDNVDEVVVYMAKIATQYSTWQKPSQ